MTRSLTSRAHARALIAAPVAAVQRIRRYRYLHSEWPTLAVATVLVGLVPLVFWTGLTGSSMNLGGDNGLLYFAYPMQWLSHTSVTAVSQNLSGYNPIPQYVPLSFLLLVIHMTGLNTEGAFLGIILAALFLGTVKVANQVLRLAFPERDPARLAAPSFLAGVIVVSAPILGQTQWSAILPGLWWDALLPWVLVCYFKHQVTGKLVFAIAGALVCSLLASAIADAPVTIGCILAALLLVASLHVADVSQIRLLRGLTFVAVIVTTSAFWTVPFAASFLQSQLQVQGALSTGGREAATALVEALAPLQSPLAAAEMRLGTKFMLAFRWPQLAPSRWSTFLGPVGALPCVLTMLALGTGVRLAPKSRPLRLLVFLALSTAFVLTLLAPDLALGERLMLSLIRVVPGWTATRNFYNVFGLPSVFLLALATSLAVTMLSVSRLHLLASRSIIVIMSVALLVYNAPFLAGSYFRLPYQLGGNYNRVVTGLPNDYMDLLARLSKLPPGPVLSLPLSAPAWTVIPDPAVPKEVQGVYVGISPVYFLTGRSDYNGVGSFANAIAPSLPSDVQSELTVENTHAFVQLVRALGVRYIILNRGPLARTGYYGVGAVGNPLVEATETLAIVRALAPTVVATRGAFELRSVSDPVPYPVRVVVADHAAGDNGYILQTALGLATASLTTCPTWSVAVASAAPWQVTVWLAPRRGASGAKCSLILDYPQSSLWTATVESRGRPILHPVSRPALGLFTEFKLPTGPAKPLAVVIDYQGELFVAAGFGVSLLAWVGLMLAGATRLRPKRHSAAAETAMEVFQGEM